MNEVGLFKVFALLPKIIAAILGAILALVLSGDIDNQGRIKIHLGLIIKFTCAVALSIYGGALLIETQGLGHLTQTAQNFIVFCCAVFGLLIIGIIYQALELLRGKRLSEVAAEVAAAFKAIFTKGV